MGKFVTTKNIRGCSIAINVEMVLYFERHDENTCVIVFKDGKERTVAETFSSLTEKMNSV